MRVLAVDGGQSAIRMRTSDDETVVEVPGVSRLEGDTVAAVADAVAEGWRLGGFGPVDRAVLGLTTAPADAAAAHGLCTRVAAAIGAPEVWLADDAVTSHAGALSMGSGVSLTAGTGVACLALRPDGEPRIVGGHGYLLGDEGGGFWIGREGLRAVLRAHDGRGDATSLSGAAERRYGPLDGLHVRLHEAERAVDAIAQFAPEVLDAAAAGDVAAWYIVNDAAWELVSVAEAAARWMAPDDAALAAPAAPAPVPLALGGRLLASGGPLRDELELVLRLARPFEARTADGTALDGALALGLAGDPGRYRGLIHAWHEGATA